MRAILASYGRGVENGHDVETSTSREKEITNKELAEQISLHGMDPIMPRDLFT